MGPMVRWGCHTEARLCWAVLVKGVRGREGGYHQSSVSMPFGTSGQGYFQKGGGGGSSPPAPPVVRTF